MVGCSRFSLALAVAGIPVAGALLSAPGCGPAAGPRPPVPSVRTVTAAERKEFTGTAVCLECHAEYAEQADSHHGTTLRPVEGGEESPRFRVPAAVKDPVHGVSYSAGIRGRRHFVRASMGRRQAEAAAEWAFGSGNRGVTYVGRYQDRPVELRISFFNHTGKWDFTPGQEVGIRPETPVGKILTPDVERDCFLCHSTALVEERGELDLVASIPGVGCETCHGPGRRHAEAARRGGGSRYIADLAAQPALVAERLCGHCHRNPENADPTNPITRVQLPRFQGLALAQSRCFQESGGRLTCVTCHNPHRNADRIPRATYNAQCASCHNPSVTPGQTACPVPKPLDCVGCHMPRQTVPIPTAPVFANHWIRVWKEEAAAGRERTGGPNPGR